MRPLTLAVASAAAALTCAPPATARPFSALYVFGDSLVDAGNAQAAALAAGAPDPAPGAAGYFEGRFTNGRNWADWLSQRLFGTNTVAALRGGTNFAFGGARAAANSDAIPDLRAQVELFLARSGGAADPSGLYYLNAGGNDAFARLFGQPDAPSVDAVATAITGSVARLAGAGARSILVGNVPNVGGAPIARGAGLADAGEAQSRLLAQAVGRALGDLPLPTGTDLFIFNSFGLGQRLAADPAAFGLPGLDLTTPCTLAGLAPECPDLAYFDLVHPTTAVAEIFGGALAATVPAPSVLALFGLGALAAAARRGRRG